MLANMLRWGKASAIVNTEAPELPRAVEVTKVVVSVMYRSHMMGMLSHLLYHGWGGRGGWSLHGLG